ncbi:hypothetical protein LMG27952_00936 [Paraburkholderia hiiakae]|uniref:Uncharacterized protein n=1 Tax=Paraburkholderia hiiakae TaxID=1081782 RepID=A0ABM8ND32_9BURK|nr:hypothetical protein LMG27952_00936 [Paraburkholderia hiiakae]
MWNVGDGRNTPLRAPSDGEMLGALPRNELAKKISTTYF